MWNGCWCQKAGLSISKTADLLGFSRTTISKVYREWSKIEKISSERQLCGWKCLFDVRGQRRMSRLVKDDRKVSVTQISTRYNQGRAVVKSTFVESKTSPSPKRFESESSPSPKRFESESSPSPKRFESKSKWDGQNRERKKSSSKPHT